MNEWGGKWGGKRAPMSVTFFNKNDELNADGHARTFLHQYFMSVRLRMILKVHGLILLVFSRFVNKNDELQANEHDRYGSDLRAMSIFVDL